MTKNFIAAFLVGLITFNAWAQQDTALNLAKEAKTINFKDDPSIAALDSMYKHTFFYSSKKETLDSFDLGNTLYPDSIYEMRMAQLNAVSPMALDYNPIVRGYIDLYIVKRRNQVVRMLGLAEYYFPLFEATLDKYNMPLELKYLAIVESALNPTAKSRAGAKGLWQFMYGTAIMNNLSVNSYVDDRYDPIKSTEAACIFMTKLYKIYGDWNLVLAAYNSGPGNVNKAIRRSGGKRDYWHLRPFLPRETAGYVPAFIAVNYVMAHAKDHGLYPQPSYYKHHQVDTLTVKEMLSFEQVVKTTGIERQALEFLNPCYVHEIIPQVKNKHYTLVLPKKYFGVFVNNEDSIYAMAVAENEAKKTELPAITEGEQRTTHKVRSGESLGGIANKYGVRVSQIKTWNGLRSDMIRAGQRLIVYPRKQVVETKKTTPKRTTTPVPENAAATTYVVQSGDTLYDIAKKYSGISATQIQDWNKLQNAAIKPGMKLVIYH